MYAHPKNPAEKNNNKQTIKQKKTPILVHQGNTTIHILKSSYLHMNSRQDTHISILIGWNGKQK